MKHFLIFILFTLAFTGQGQIINTIIGLGTPGTSGDGGPASLAKVINPHSCTFDRYGNFYFSEYTGQKVRRISIEGIVTTVAGTGSIGFGGDGGAANLAKFRFPEGLAFDSAGNLYIADRQNFRVRKVDRTTGIISTVVGTGVAGDGGDGGPAISATIFPADICFDKKGNLYITDNAYHKVRKVSTDGTISLFAGSGTTGFSGDGGPAVSARMWNPNFITADDTGNVYVADAMNKRIRKIDTFGIITTVAGTGTALFNGDGILALSANIGPLGIAWSNNNLYITDSNERVRKIDKFGIITTLAGTGVSGYNGDGIPAVTAQLNNLGGIVLDDCENVYFADVMNYRIRKITFNPLSTPTITVSAVSAAPLGSTVTVTATVAGAGSTYSIKWFNKGVLFATTTAPTVTYTKVHTVDSITARIVPAVTYCYDSTTSAVHVVNRSGVGISNLSQGSDFFIYPNPARTTLHVSGQGTGHITVSNLLGQPVLSAAYTAGKAELNVAALPAGVYTVKVWESSGAQQVFKFVKE